MKKFLSNRWVEVITAIAILLAISAGILIARIPYSFSGFFNQYSLAFFLLAWAAFSLSFRARGWAGWVLGLALTLILFTLPLSYKWTSGFSDNRVIAGLIPYKDQFFYYHGAREVLSGRLIPAGFLQAVWRPLFPAFFSNLLFLTGASLKWSLAILTCLSAAVFYCAGREVRRIGGSWGAGLYLTLLLFYSSYYIGMVASELAATALACLASALLLYSARKRSRRQFFAGVIVLMLSLSMRASAFLIFPFLAAWSGWVFREQKRFSWRILGASAIVMAGSFLLFNTISQKLLVVPGSAAQGNFAYTIYGQAMGGTGYHRAVEDWGTDPSLIYTKTLEAIRDHPLSLGIGTVKAYRDFLSPDYQILIPLKPLSGKNWLNIFPWAFIGFLYIWGMVKLIRTWREPVSSFLLAATLGILLSVPFLPPIDGGARFYTNVAPILLMIPAFALGDLLSRRVAEPVEDHPAMIRCLEWAAIFAVGMVIVTPLLLKLTKPAPVVPTVCPPNLVPFQVVAGRDSYVDILPAGGAGLPSGLQVSLEDFKANGAEPWDDFYQFLVAEAEAADAPLRFFAAKDEVKGKMHFFLGDASLFAGLDPGLPVNGCAETTRTTYQGIYLIKCLKPAAD